MIRRAVPLLALAAAGAAAPGPGHAQPARPNILVLFGEDIGQTKRQRVFHWA